MSTMTVFDNEYASLFYHPDTKIVHHCFHVSLDSEHLRKALNGGIELLKEHHAVKWLSDNRAIGPHSDPDTQWINEKWLPRAIATGWKYWALVVPHDFMARINMNEFVNSFYEKGVRIMVFVEVDKAMQWLENIDSN